LDGGKLITAICSGRLWVDGAIDNIGKPNSGMVVVRRPIMQSQPAKDKEKRTIKLSSIGRLLK
jgi:hypothetical protein